jgi:Gluconate 2-dehydrogenase subunit 3
MAEKPTKPNLVGRRNVLKYGGLLTATAAGQEFLASWLPKGTVVLNAEGIHGRRDSNQVAQESPRTNASEPLVPRFFKPDEFQTVEILTEMIIPSDDKPGAKEAQVARFIDFVVYSASEFEPELREKWAKGLALLDKLSKAKYGRSFRETSASDREQLLTEMSRPEHDPLPITSQPSKNMKRRTGRPEYDPSATHPAFPFYRLVKEITVEAFYSSKIGLMDVLEYKGLSVNASFPGCTHPEHQA